MQCPSCGIAIDWHKRFAQMIVCESCHAALLIDRDALELVGKQSALAEPTGLLYVGARGSIEGEAFLVVGRVRYDYGRGFWDEWCLQRDDGGLVWVAEDDGELTYTREVTTDSTREDFERSQPGRGLWVGGRQYQIREKGTAKCLGGEGQLPFVAAVGEEVGFLSLRQGDKRVGTLEFDGKESRLFVGHRVDVAALKVEGADFIAPEPPQGPTGQAHVVTGQGLEKMGCFACGAPLEVEGGAMSLTCGFCSTQNDIRLPQVGCPACGGVFGLAAGQDARTASCPKCHAVLEVSNGAVSSVANSAREALQAAVPNIAPFQLGQRCQFDGVEFVLTGHVRTEVYEEGVAYPADSLMLFSKEHGHRWLEWEEGHFVLAERVNEAPLMNLYDYRDRVLVDGESYRFFDSGKSTVVWVSGQLPYVAKVGDVSEYYDAIRPPHIFTTETTDSEIEGFKGVYKSVEQIREAFSFETKTLAEPRGVGAAQPYVETTFRRHARGVMAFYAVLLLLMTGYSCISGSQVYRETISGEQFLGERYFETRTFEVTRPDTVVEFDVEAGVDNSWLYLEVMMIDEKSQVTHEFSSNIEYYYGYEGGESWSEGSRDHAHYLKVREPGLYRFAFRGESPSSVSMGLVVRQGVWLTRYPLILLVFGAFWIFFDWLRTRGFENQRWKHALEDDDDD